jgi:hypothetical protein
VDTTWSPPGHFVASVLFLGIRGGGGVGENALAHSVHYRVVCVCVCARARVRVRDMYIYIYISVRDIYIYISVCVYIHVHTKQYIYRHAIKIIYNCTGYDRQGELRKARGQ